MLYPKGEINMETSRTVIGDLYNSLFASQTSNPSLMVNYEVWNQIKSSLPAGYLIPDPYIMNTLNQQLYNNK
jgi:hypothetical protein